MKLIKLMEELIEEEIHDMKKYAKLAAEVKDAHPLLAQTFFALSTQEDGHQAALHNEVVKLIEDYRKEHGDPPAAMQAVYDYLHKKHVEKLEESKHYQDIYKGK